MRKTIGLLLNETSCAVSKMVNKFWRVFLGFFSFNIDWQGRSEGESFRMLSKPNSLKQCNSCAHANKDLRETENKLRFMALHGNYSMLMGRFQVSVRFLPLHHQSGIFLKCGTGYWIKERVYRVFQQLACYYQPQFCWLAFTAQTLSPLSFTWHVIIKAINYLKIWAIDGKWPSTSPGILINTEFNLPPRHIIELDSFNLEIKSVELSYSTRTGL